MTPKTNAKPNAKVKPSAKVPDTPPSPANNSYSPSVPISLYREVANELQSTKTRIESLKLQNQELTQQNQQLRVEIERVVQSALQLRQVADAQKDENQPTLPESSTPNVEVYFEQSPASVVQPVLANPVKADLPEFSTPHKPLFTEQQPPQPKRKLSQGRSSDMGGWWLMLAIFVIIVTAFGTGFLIVRPLLPSR